MDLTCARTGLINGVDVTAYSRVVVIRCPSSVEP